MLKRLFISSRMCAFICGGLMVATIALSGCSDDPTNKPLHPDNPNNEHKDPDKPTPKPQEKIVIEGHLLVKYPESLIPAGGEVTLPNEVTEIAAHAFKETDRLVKVTGPEVVKIGESAFHYDRKMIEANFPKLQVIGKNTFNHCEMLEKIDFPVCKEVGKYAFIYCPSIKTINLPKVEKISDAAFSGSEKLQEVTLGEKVPATGGNAFDNTPITKVLKVAEGKQNDFIPFANKFHFIKVNDLEIEAKGNLPKNAVVEKGVLISAPDGYDNITLPPYVTKIGKGALADKTTLDKVLALGVEELEEEALSNSQNITDLDLPNLVIIGKRALYKLGRIHYLNFPKVTEIGESALENVLRLKEIRIPSIEKIGPHAFDNCKALRTIYMGATPPTVGDGAFDWTGNITIVVPVGSKDAYKEFVSKHGFRLVDISEVK